MDLSTKYLGLELPHPLMPGASPLTTDLDDVRRLEDAGAAAIVMHSLFEEQILLEEKALLEEVEAHEHSFAEALSFFPQVGEYRMGAQEYLDQIRKIKEAVSVPVIASLNGVTPGGWTRYARQMESAGADAIELNVYFVASSLEDSADTEEEKTLELLKSIRQEVKIPVAVKLSPFYTTLPHFAKRLEDAGADGLVLFNRFYQPDIDIEQMEVSRSLELSDSSALRLRLRWLAVLSPILKTSLAATGGVHSASDAIKAVMAGASAVQLVSALLKEDPSKLASIRQEMASWMEKHRYESLEQMRGSMNLERSPNPSAYERANYVHILQGWRG